MADWMDVAEAIKERRLALELSQRAAATSAGVSTTTWNRVEVKHLNVDDVSQAAMARALHWPHDAIRRILRGESPTSIPDVDPPATWTDMASMVRVIEGMKAQMDEMREGDQRSLVDRLTVLEEMNENLLEAFQSLERHVRGQAAEARSDPAEQ